jgi:hypothetical protein
MRARKKEEVKRWDRKAVMSRHISWIRTQLGNSLIAPSIQDYNIKTFRRSPNYNSWEDFAKFFSKEPDPAKNVGNLPMISTECTWK